MINNDHASNQHVGSLPTIPTAPPPVDNVENQSSVMGVESSTIVRRCKREGLIKKFSLALRGLALIFSVIALIIMAINKHSEFRFHYEYDSWEDHKNAIEDGGWQDFDKMENIVRVIHAILNWFLRFSVSLRHTNLKQYVLAIAILSTVYTGGQVMRQAYELCTGKLLLQQRSSTLLDFFGDQIMAYLLISAASSALPLTICLRTLAYQKFTERQFIYFSASEISMAFLAFSVLAFSAITSVYRLSTLP